MADPIMDLFDDTPLFNLDSLPEDAFSHGSSDPVEEALKLALGQVDPPSDTGTVVLSDPMASVSSGPAASAVTVPPAAPMVIPTAAATAATVQVQAQQPIQVQTHQPVQIQAQQPLQVQTQQPMQVSLTQAVPVSIQAPVSVQAVPQTVSVTSNSSGATTVLMSSPLTVSGGQTTTLQLQPQQLAAVTQQAAGQGAPKIVILKGPQGQMLQGVTGATGSPSGKVTIARVLTGTPLRPGMSIVSGGTVLNATAPGQGQVKLGTGVQRLVQTANGPVKQVLLTSVPQSQVQTQTQPMQVQIQPQAQLGQTQVQLQTQGQQVQLQTQGQTAQVQMQPQTQQVSLQAPMQTHTVATTTAGTTTAVRPQGITLSTMPQQVRVIFHTLLLA